MRRTVRRQISRLNKRTAVLLFLFAALGVVAMIKYVYAPRLASVAASTIAEGYGANLTIESWSVALRSLTATARRVTLSTEGKSYCGAPW